MSSDITSVLNLPHPHPQDSGDELAPESDMGRLSAEECGRRLVSQMGQRIGSELGRIRTERNSVVASLTKEVQAHLRQTRKRTPFVAHALHSRHVQVQGDSAQVAVGRNTCRRSCGRTCGPAPDNLSRRSGSRAVVRGSVHSLPRMTAQP